MIVSYFSKEKFVQEEHEFDNHVLDISMAGKDIFIGWGKILCDELATSTARA